MTYRYDCRKFSGYKPCKPGMFCNSCGGYDPMGKRILLINLDAMGDVLRTTAVLNPIKRKYEKSHITWLTDKNAVPLLENNPLIDRIYSYGIETVLPLLCEEFDIVMNVDKSGRSASLANLIKSKEKFGFGLTKEGAIYPFNKEARYLYNLGLNDEEKFKKNKKTEQQLLAEAFALKYKRDEYMLNLTDAEKAFVKSYKDNLGLKDEDVLLGFNTGCSNLYPYKKMPFEKQAALIETLLNSIKGAAIALLGGKEDTLNNARLKDRFKDGIISTPTDMGLRYGILFIEACNAVITGDTLGLHIAIALKKPVVSWFSVSCEREIDLYERGVKVLSRVDCRPCWKKVCGKLPKCNEMVDLGEITESVKGLLEKVETNK